MQNNNNHKTDFDCTFGETLVAVLYGEATAQEIAGFESHLENCRDCGEELAAFGTLRNAVSEWREIEFEPSVTPKIVLPNEKNTIETAALEKTSLLQTLRAFFTPANLGWQMAAVCLAVFAVFVLFFISSTGLIKSPADEANAPGLIVSSAPEIATVPEIEPQITETIAPKEETTSDDSGQVNENKRPTPARIIRKTAKQSDASTSRVENLPKRRNQIHKTGNLTPDLSLSPVADAEDDSPRLTDLLEEIEPST